MRLLIKGGRVIDPGNHLDGVMDIIIEDGIIIKIKDMAEPTNIDQVVDATDKIVAPGFIDMHVHLREPGHEYKETIHSGCQAAAHGGFTAICCMPNTNPVNDNRQITEYIINKAREGNGVRVYPIAAISKGLEGENLCEYGDLIDAGAIAVSDDGKPVMNSQLMRRALEYAGGFGLRVISHCEDLYLSENGVMNEGIVSTKKGLRGIPNAAESIMVMRDIALSELTGVPIHIAHVSTLESVRAIRDAKQRGVPVTAETAPHYFSLTEEAIGLYNTNAKMNPPLRSQKDREAIREGLADGTIDVIATDHAPHSSLEKDVEFDQAANGIIGLETSVALSLMLVHEDILSLSSLIEKMSINPSHILGLPNGIKVGNAADITIIDPEVEYIVDASHFHSLSKNTPFDGWMLKGMPVMTIVDGKIIVQN